MIVTERMRKLEAMVLRRDVDEVLRYLGFAGCLQLITGGGSPRELAPDERELVDLRGRVEALARFLGIDPRSGAPAGPAGAPGAPAASIPRDELRERSLRLLESSQALVAEEAQLLQLKLNLKQSAEELAGFAHLKVAFSELEHLTYLAFRLGSVAPERVPDVVAALERRALVISLGRPGFIMAIAPKKGRWALDSELRKFAFQESKFPSELKGVPSEVLPAVERSLGETEAALAGLAEAKAAERARVEGELRSLLADLTLDVSIDTVKQGLAATGSVLTVSGWVPRKRFTEVAQGLEQITRGRMALRAYEPEEVPDVRSGKAKVPVSLQHGRLVRAFERMVFSYSVPLYGTIDPTPFVAVMFVLLFAIMFGDVGQGAIALAIGLLINRGRLKGLERYRLKNFGLIFVCVGIASMITGFLYGSFFANEQVLTPLVRAVTGWLGRPVDRILVITEGPQRILGFFGFTIGVGAVINSIGIVINIVNQVRLRDWEKAFLSKTGLAGALFFWYALSLAVRMLLGKGLSGPFIAPLAVPLAALFFREPLYRLLCGKRPVLKEGFLTFFMEGIVEILESVTYYVSNSVSFLRVAAFAMAHAVLSLIVFDLSAMVGTAPGGIVYQVLIVVVGNLVIIVLEGLIVTIQVVRLQYYEFFSKFFTETGEEFKPFTLHASGGQ